MPQKRNFSLKGATFRGAPVSKKANLAGSGKKARDLGLFKQVPGVYGDTEGMASGSPSNQLLLTRTTTYAASAADSLRPGIDGSREFLLNDLVPPLLAMQNGLQDGFDVLRLMMGEEPTSAGAIYNPMQQLLALALKTKMTTFIAKHANLSPAETKVFLELALLGDSNGAAETDRKYLAVNELIKSLANSGKSNTPVPALDVPTKVVNRRREGRAANRKLALEERNFKPT